jgi:translocation and assembly module TamA
MRRFVVFRRAAAFLTLILSLSPMLARAADPQPYTVELKPTGDADLDAAVKDSSALVTLREKAAVGGFALVQRARDDAARFEDAARAFGYYNGTVAITIGTKPLDDPTLSETIDKAPAAPPITVAVTLTAGPRFHLGQISIEGATPPSAVASLDLREGQDALAANVVAARSRLLAALREASYPLATVTLLPAVLHRDQRQLDVSFQVVTGPKAAIGQIQFNGLRDMSEDFMRRRLTIRPGDPFSPAKIDSARQDLESLGVFNSVRILPADHLDPQGNLPLAVDVDERKLHAVDLGAGWSTDLGATLNVGWHDRNLFGGAEQLNLTASLELGGDATTRPGSQVTAQFIKPDFLARDQSLQVSLSAVDQSLIAYDQEALIERTSITRKLSQRWSIEPGILAEQERVTQEGVTRPYNFVGLPITLKYDSTKSLLDPVSGLRVTLSATPTESFGAQGGRYLVLQASGSTYFDLGATFGLGTTGRSVIALRGLVGQISGTGVFGLPPDQRLYAGGSATVRGYRYQSIGPQFPDGRPTGGTAVSAATVEYRQRFLENWGAAAFLDVGQASANGAPFTADWRAGAGVGLRYYTPIGPIRVDVAVPLIHQNGSDAFEAYIGIGQAF